VKFSSTFVAWSQFASPACVAPRKHLPVALNLIVNPPPTLGVTSHIPVGGEVTTTDKPEFEVGFTVIGPFLLSLVPGFMKVMLWLLLVMRCEVKFGAMALLSRLLLVTNAFELGIATKKVHKNKMATEMNLVGKMGLANIIGS